MPFSRGHNLEVIWTSCPCIYRVQIQMILPYILQLRKGRWLLKKPLGSDTRAKKSSPYSLDNAAA